MAGEGKRRITELPEASSIGSGDYFAIDSESGGTKKLSQSALPSKAELAELKNDLTDYSTFETNGFVKIEREIRPAGGITKIDINLDDVTALQFINNGLTRAYANTVRADGTNIAAVGLNTGETNVLAVTPETDHIALYADTYPISFDIKSLGSGYRVADLLDNYESTGQSYTVHYTVSDPAAKHLYVPNIKKNTRFIVEFEEKTRTAVNLGVAFKKAGDTTNYQSVTMYHKNKILDITATEDYNYLQFYRNSAAADFTLTVTVRSVPAQSDNILNNAVKKSNSLIDAADFQQSGNLTLAGSVDIDSGFIKLTGTNGSGSSTILNDSKPIPAGEYVARFVFKNAPPVGSTFGFAKGTTTGYADFAARAIQKEYIADFTLSETTNLNGYFWCANGSVVDVEFNFWIGTIDSYNRDNSFNGYNLQPYFDKQKLCNNLADVLNDKKINFLGDSITYGSGAAFPFTKVLETYSTAVVRNYGIHGSTLQYRSDTYPMCVRYADMDDDADIVAVMGGTNDYWLNLPLGVFGDTSTNTYYGALDVLINGIIKKYPRAFFYMVAPPHGYIQGDYTEETKSNIGSMNDVVTAIKKVSEKYSVPVLDLFNSGGLYPRISEQKSAYYSDGVHLNDRGQTKLAYLHAAFIRSHYNYG